MGGGWPPQAIKDDYRNRVREAEAARAALRGDVEASEEGLCDLCAPAAPSPSLTSLSGLFPC